MGEGGLSKNVLQAYVNNTAKKYDVVNEYSIVLSIDLKCTQWVLSGLRQRGGEERSLLNGLYKRKVLDTYKYIHT